MEKEMVTQLVSKIVAKLSTCSSSVSIGKPIPTGVSNRHIHLSRNDLECLFGKGYSIKCQKELSQPGQCAAFETVIIAGPKGCIEQVRVLGPERKQTQVEISRSDAYKLGINPPLRESGNVTGSAEITVIGPKGSLQLSEGTIIAKRHLHMSPTDAATYEVTDNQLVQVKVPGERGVTFDNVVVRVSDKFVLEFHIDMDEANATGIRQGEMVYLQNVLGAMETFKKENILMDQKMNVMSNQPERKFAEKTEAKSLITEDIVKDAWKRKLILYASKSTIFTPLARDTIKELGVEIIWN